MLNQNLPSSVLQESLKEYIDSVDFILNEILGQQKFSIVENKNLMGKLHHAFNISHYSNSEFRKSLLTHARKDDLEKFLRRIGLITSSTVDENKLSELISKASNLPWDNNDQTRAFVEIFGYEKNLIPTTIKNKPDFEIIHHSDFPLKTLKDYQSKIFFESTKLAENAWTRFIIKMPTGAGKTRTTLEIISHFINNGIEINEERQVVWLADREELCDQAIESLLEVWPHLGKKDLKLYRLWGDAKFDSFENNAFIVATYQKLNSILKNEQLFPQPHLVISDEAHNVLAPTHQAVLRKLEENGTRIIGLTATPVRGFDSMENTRLREYFNDKIIEIDSGDENAIEYLQREGYLSYYIPETIPSHRQFNLTREQRRILENERDLPKGFLDQIAKDNQRNLIIAEYLKKLKEENSQVLYFAPSVKQSKFMCALILALGGSAAHVDGSTPIEYRRDVISKFKKGEIKFIFNYNVFSTGFDAPNIDAIFIARPTTSIVLHQQMIGRGMRGPKMGGTESFRLYRVVDDLPDIELADEYFSEIWNV